MNGWVDETRWGRVGLFVNRRRIRRERCVL